MYVAEYEMLDIDDVRTNGSFGIEATDIGDAWQKANGRALKMEIQSRAIRGPFWSARVTIKAVHIAECA